MPSDLTAELRVEDMRELFDHVDRAYQRDRELASRMQALYWGEHKLNVIDTMAKGRKRKIQPERMVTEEASRIINLLHSFYIQPANAALEWKGESSKAQSVSDKIEIAVNEGYDQLNPTQDKPRRDVRFDQILLGKGAQLGPMPGNAYWWDFPYKDEGQSERQWTEAYEEWRKAGPLPFAYVALPGDSTWPASYGLVNDLCLSAMSVSYYDLQDMFSPDELERVVDDKEKDANEEFMLALVSNREYLAYALMDVAGSGFMGTQFFRNKEDKLLRSVQHGMGRSVIKIPPGITRSKHHTRDGYGYYWVPAIYHVADLIVQADRMLSIAATASKFDALPPQARYTGPEIGSEGAAGKTEWGQEGDIIDFPLDQEGRKLGFMEPLILPRFGEKTQALVAWLLGRTERLGGAGEIMEGMSAETTAWATNQAVQLATSRHAPLTDAIASADMADFEMLMRATEMHKHKIDLRRDEDGGTIALVPGEMASWRVGLKGEYKPNTPVNEIALLQTGIMMQQAANEAKVPLSWDTIAEKMGIEQPWEEYKRWIGWQAAMDPRTYDRLYARRMDEADATLNEAERISAEQMAEEYGKLTPEQQARARVAYGALAQGAGRAGAPFSTQPGGPQPMETIPGVTA